MPLPLSTSFIYSAAARACHPSSLCPIFTTWAAIGSIQNPVSRFMWAELPPAACLSSCSSRSCTLPANGAGKIIFYLIGNGNGLFANGKRPFFDIYFQKSFFVA
jgi:hypothetical protein